MTMFIGRDEHKQRAWRMNGSKHPINFNPAVLQNSMFLAVKLLSRFDESTECKKIGVILNTPMRDP